MAQEGAGEPAIKVNGNGKIIHRADAPVHEIVADIETLCKRPVEDIFVNHDEVDKADNLVPGPNAEIRVYLRA